MMRPELDRESHTAWVSQGFEQLVARVRSAPQVTHFDVLVIGSGYGGAVAAATFAGRHRDGVPIAVAVLERGKEYLPGSFPVGLGELPGHLRRDNQKEGLFDVRASGDVVTVVANGVGGGSLINAGVMDQPLPSVFAQGWPRALADVAGWQPYFDRAAELLGARIDGVPNTIADHPDGLPQKFRSIRDVAPDGRFRPAAITVAMSQSTSSGNVRLGKCVRCGDCATGCNFGAKNSLDVGLLVRAQQNGAEIFSGATVLSVEAEGAGWIVNAVYTNASLRKRDGEVLRIRAGKVVLAAGTLGSTEILMRSQAAGLAVSGTRLGRRASTNGDMLVADYATAASVDAVADEEVQPSLRAIGPTITGIIDLRDTAGVLIEEMAVPASLRLAFTELFAVVNTLHGLDEADRSKHIQGYPDADLYAAPGRRIGRSAIYAIMGDDGAAGTITLEGDVSVARDGIARMQFTGLPEDPVNDRRVEALADLTRGTGGRVIANPIWKLLPTGLNWLLAGQRGPLLTVHPLGGCVMADDGTAGVVDHLGRVFSTDASDAVHNGLVVLDGSVIPTALGINPALTISAVALRAAETLAQQWEFEPGLPARSGQVLVRPVFREVDVAMPPARTEVEIIERLVGPLRLSPKGAPTADYVVELTLRFRPKAVADLIPGRGGEPVLEVAGDQSSALARSEIRIFPQADWEMLEQTWDPPRLREQKLDAMAVFSAPLTGRLKVFERQERSALRRIFTAGTAWLLNRGLRDSYQAFVDGDGGPDPLSRLKSAIGIASCAGEIRALVYELTIGTPATDSRFVLEGDRIVGAKSFTYRRRANPWRQLMEVTLREFPGLEGRGARMLKLDVGFLARIGVPLIQITHQRDGVSALSDLASFLGYVLRLLLGLHIWSFRAPDNDGGAGEIVFRPPRELMVPGGGFVPAEIIPIDLDDEIPDLGAEPVKGRVVLTRYAQPVGGPAQRPVVMLHGYSAGGTTFAHHAVNPNLASYLWDAGRDVWIADLRTSPAHETAKAPWSFDQIARTDVRAVIERAAGASIDGKVDVIAHCMGTVVFSMAVLGDVSPPGKRLSKLIGRAAFTQVGPLVVFTPANIFRAYAVRYLLDFLPDAYEFRPPNPTLLDGLLDRVLATLPYSDEEYDIENPLWPAARTPWTRTRHRMDALYGRDFNVANMEPLMLRHIDEHFGPLNLKTVATTVHFARYAVMTDYKGQNTYVSRRQFRENWPFPTFSLHGGANGLSHVSTVDRMHKVLSDAGRIYLAPYVNWQAGHQDALIGTGRLDIFARIRSFLETDIPDRPNNEGGGKTAYPPWIGPIVTEERPDRATLVVRVGALPSHREAEAVAMLRIELVGDDIRRPDDAGRPWDLSYVLDHLAIYRSQELHDTGWDAFEAPLPTAMPGYDARHPGNALLVLLVYDESDELLAGIGAAKTTRDYFWADSQTRKVYRLEPTIPPSRESRPAHGFAYRQFTQMARAVCHALGMPTPKRRPAGPATAAAHRLTYRGLTQASRPMLEAAPGRTRVERSPMTMQFDQAGTGDTVGGLNEMDRDLMDGVIPYDPPFAPLPAPAPAGTRFSLASCQYPGGFFDAAVAYRSYERIVQRFEDDPGLAPRFMLFAGDQVYVDPTAGLYDPASKDSRFRLPYEAWLRQPNVRSALRRAPSFMLLDDHEIADNWEPVAVPDDPLNQMNKTHGVAMFAKYQRGIKDDIETFDFDGFPFFLLDTRTRRSHRRVGSLADATLFDEATMDRLKCWLSSAPGPKFIVSPVMLLPRHRRAVQRDRRLDPTNLSALYSDGWDGYPHTLREVLAFIAANRIERVVFLSGDEHRGYVATVDLFDSAGNRLVRAHSIHTAALYGPFPFANGVAEDVVASETIAIEHSSGHYSCVVDTVRPAPGDGATFFHVRKVGEDWLLDCEFGDGAVHTLTV
ncbi:alkaline phosphatase D family protein [Chelatococcus reniformis]|uniref:Cholesterol oxidase n=1 Tax=Chelatococcus reniformis TaxID=1494448 RepID=A0A916UWT1_9HYPH|nr:alkaline phosphatase D family protein [Chelatococcus reniformis]GGC91063.1 hypothetical protein GCM10010994_56070 [Chelatococcus reniformis]